jgi:hypothetical protein
LALPARRQAGVRALKTRTKVDFAVMLKEISDTFYSAVDKIILVADNLNTHNISSFYEAFKPETAFRLMQKFEFHYTPIHGSWLNTCLPPAPACRPACRQTGGQVPARQGWQVAECELSSLAVQALGNQRIKSVDCLNEILVHWQNNRNSRQKGVNWQFTNEDARIKLNRLYPKPIFD